MNATIRTISAVLAGAVLAALFVGFTPDGQPEAKATLGPLQAVTLTGADFHPTNDTVSFDSNGNHVRGDGAVIARIPFPAEVVVITSVKARVYDNTNSGDLCVSLYRARPGDATQDHWGNKCTVGSSTTDPQTLSISVFKRVGRFHTAYLWAPFGVEDFALRLYGVTVFYRIVT